MLKLSRAQINKIKEIIGDHMEVLMLLTGDGKPSPELIKKLGLPKSASDLITDAFVYGKLSILKDKDLSKMSAVEVSQLMKDIKMTKAQQAAVDYLKIKAQTHIDTLTQKITSQVITSTVQNDMSLWTSVKEVVPKAMEEGLSRSEVVQELRNYSKDWERDWERVAHTEMWGAKCKGEAQAIINGESPLSKKGADTVVFKRPSPRACNKCIQLYLEKDRKTPRLFKLSELMANGSNYGKKQADWLATLEPLHPNCMCVLNIMPIDMKFDENGDMVPNL